MKCLLCVCAASPVGNSGLRPAAQLQKGGVMDVLGKSSAVSPATQLKTTGSVMDVLGGSAASKTTAKDDQKLPPLSSVFKTTSAGTWNCPTCMVQNKDAQLKCPCCETAKPGNKSTPVTEPQPSTSGLSSSSKLDSSKPSLSAMFKQTAGWSCPTCMVHNKDTQDKCPCCQEPKPGGSKPQTAAATSTAASAKIDSSKPSLASVFKSRGGWSCPTCMVQNDDSLSKCPCCETSRPGAAPVVSGASSASQNNQVSTMFRSKENSK